MRYLKLTKVKNRELYCCNEHLFDVKYSEMYQTNYRTMNGYWRSQKSRWDRSRSQWDTHLLCSLRRFLLNTWQYDWYLFLWSYVNDICLLFISHKDIFRTVNIQMFFRGFFLDKVVYSVKGAYYWFIQSSYLLQGIIIFKSHEIFCWNQISEACDWRTKVQIFQT